MSLSSHLGTARRITVSVIGSFRHHYAQVIVTVKELESSGLTVKSPVVSRIINPGDDFVRFETDPQDSPDELIQAATLEKILTSDIAYVVAPEGYIGRTTCYELGRIHARAIPVYFSAPPRDLPIAVSSKSVLSVSGLVHLVLGESRQLSSR